MVAVVEDCLAEDDLFSEDVEDTPSHLTENKRKLSGLPLKQPSKKQRKELYKQPTAEELNQLRETENLFNSNLFRLQIEELLSEIQVKQKYKNIFEVWYRTFLNVIENLPEHDDVTLSQLYEKESKHEFLTRLTQLQKPKFKCDQDVHLKFIRPKRCTITGLQALNCNVGPTLNVNVIIEMPKKCLYEKDYLNNRYLMKRYYYLFYIAVEIENANICSNIALSHYVGLESLPVLKLTPDASKKICVKISIVPPENYFKDARFFPNKNNIKTNLSNVEDVLKEEEYSTYATPYYNSLLLQNYTEKRNNLYFLNTLKPIKSAVDGLQLIIVWLKQRDLYNIMGITDQFLLQLMAFLVSKRHINKHMSSYQIIRNFWYFISKSDWINEPISICNDVKSDTFLMFRDHFDVVFLDGTGCFNVTWLLNLEVYLKLKHEATLAVQFLDDRLSISFDCLFLKKIPFPLQYDTVCRFKSVENCVSEADNVDCSKKILFHMSSELLSVRKILSTLNVGLKKRVFRLVPYLQNSEVDCDMYQEPKQASTDLFIGIDLNMDHAFNVLELGPTPHDPKVKEFIKFWGELTTLRRFPDGTTCEAVYFETKTIKDKREIINKIISFIAKKRLNLEYELFFSQFEDVMMLKKFVPPFPFGTNEEVSLKVISIADELGKKLRSLELPLEIASISGNANVFSYTDLFPPIPRKHKFNKNTMFTTKNCMGLKETGEKIPSYLAPIENVIQLSLHSKWPDNLEAVRHIKTAFLLKISELLWSSSVKSKVTRDYLDVFYEGLVLRYRIYHPKEVALIKRIITEEGVISYKDNKESIKMEMELNLAPKIFSALKGIQSQHPSYGPSTALIKRWLRSHLIDEFYLSDMVINLLNASLYLNNAPFSTSVLPQIAFLRFLKFMFETDWTIRPVVVNFNNEFSGEALDEIENEFHQKRDSYPVLFIVMPFDDAKSLYTKTSPTKEILRRIAVLGKQCFEVFCNSVTGGTLSSVLPLFTPNLAGFNVIIHLKLTKNSTHYQKVEFKHRKKVVLEQPEKTSNISIPVVGFNPVSLYVEDLRKNYGKFALFFHDTYGGNIIGVLWKPSAVEAIDFKVSQVAAKKVVDGKLCIDFDAVINDFCIIGKGIVKRVERKS